MTNEKDYPPYLDYPKPRKIQTNADRIRAMSDEELAEMISRFVTTGACNDLGIPSKKKCDSNCKVCILEWLRQPVEDE